MLIEVHVRPNTKKNQIDSFLAPNIFHVSLHALAKEGEANNALLRVLADHLHIAPSLITLKRGEKSRIKLLEIPNGTPFPLS
ncbi:MAG: DUF167 domain-containing protein [Patescibacteria group bacterium]|jgi:uncharacterized protein (TIGR00251 family)